jgi:NADH:ubiquinone oxidoreductase subunit 3 (subunit A)
MSSASATDYRSAFLVVGVVFSFTLAWLLWVRRMSKPREQRHGGKHETAWIQFDITYAVPALIFLAFDMEMIFMFPWAVAFQEVGMTALWDMFVFAAILGVALIYAAKRGAFHI